MTTVITRLGYAADGIDEYVQDGAVGLPHDGLHDTARVGGQGNSDRPDADDPATPDQAR